MYFPTGRANTKRTLKKKKDTPWQSIRHRNRYLGINKSIIESCLTDLYIWQIQLYVRANSHTNKDENVDINQSSTVELEATIYNQNEILVEIASDADVIESD